MHVTLKHPQTKEAAIAHIKKMLHESRGKLAEAQVTDFEEKWEGDTLHFSFTAQKQHLSGTLEVRDREFDLNVKLPLALRLFEKRIEKMIEAQASKMLQ